MKTLELEQDAMAGLSASGGSAGASAIDELDKWRIACNWKSTNPAWDDTLKIVIAFAREGKRLAAQPNAPGERRRADDDGLA